MSTTIRSRSDVGASRARITGTTYRPSDQGEPDRLLGSCGPLVPCRMRPLLARVVLALSRYKITGTPPEDPVCVMVAAPHTSNWDFILMIAMAWHTGVSPVWLGKKEMFWGPLAPLFRAMGGIPVDRENPAGLATTIADR